MLTEQDLGVVDRWENTNLGLSIFFREQETGVFELMVEQEPRVVDYWESNNLELCIVGRART